MITKYELTLRRYYTDFNMCSGGSTDCSTDDYCEITKEEYETIINYLIKNRQSISCPLCGAKMDNKKII